MDLLVGGIVSGIAVGLLYGLLGFAIVVLYKCTSIANFAQGNLGAIAAFIAYELTVDAGLPAGLAIALAAVFGVAVGVLAYAFVIRVKPEAGHLNLTIRTLAIYLLLLATMNAFWGQRQPLTFPDVFPDGVAFAVTDLNVSWLTLLALTYLGSSLGPALAVSWAVGFSVAASGLIVRYRAIKEA
jgi:branched-chain amino acid transport system permease protein